jgi:Tfp pilus assembly protein PilN
MISLLKFRRWLSAATERHAGRTVPACVLLIGERQVECWRREGAGPWERQAKLLEQSDFNALMRAGGELAAGCRGNVVVLLDAPWVEHFSVDLPELAGKELRGVLARRAARGSARELAANVFSARLTPRSAQGAGTNDSAREVRWWITSTARERILRAREVLDQRRVHFVALRAARTVRLEAALAQSGAATSGTEQAQAVIIIQLEPTQVITTLMHDGVPVTETAIAGGFTRTPTLPLSIVQECKSLDAFWRKYSRGGSVRKVVLIDLPKQRAESLEPALSSALAGASVVCVPPHAQPEHEYVPLHLSVEAHVGRLATDMSPAKRASRPVLAALGACIVLAVGSAWYFAQERHSQHAQSVALTQERMDQARNAIFDCEAERTLRNGEVAAYEAEEQRVARLGSESSWAEATLAELSRALPASIRVDSITLHTGGLGSPIRQLEISGAAQGDGLASIQALRSLARALETSGLFHSVAVEPAATVTRSQDAQANFEQGFRLLAELGASG